MKIEEKIAAAVSEVIKELAGTEPEPGKIVFQKTRKEFRGDLTLVVFPFIKLIKRSPEEVADTIGRALVERVEEVSEFNSVKGFLNMSLTGRFWLGFLGENMDNDKFGYAAAETQQPPVVVEYSSPNTNKPLHLGHIRNNLLGYSVSRLLEASGNNVVKVNLVNDRGIHICKSMLAWMKYGKGETPQSSGKKGDKLVGDYYVRFETELRRQIAGIIEKEDIGEDEARKKAPLMLEAQDLLRRWEARDKEVVEVWEMMNSWVYAGFDLTYRRLGVDFDKIYYESDTYLLGRDIVMEGLEKGVMYKKDDGSVWAGLSEYKIDDKLLLRSDGTSVYMTQDIGTAQLRYDDFTPRQMVYVVGNEQNHHFSVLRKVLDKLGKPYSDAIYHLSYGMVELPAGKMKSREGTVVDADDLMDEMAGTAARITEELGKTQDFSKEEKESLYHIIGLGALKYFILKVDPKKNMLFNPEESVDFNGNTGPFIQYTYARICSVLRKAGEESLTKAPDSLGGAVLNEKEKQLVRTLYDFPAMVREAAAELSPARIANYVYEVAREFNQFYHDYSILNEEDKNLSDMRLCLSSLTALTIRNAMLLLGIEVPERM